MMVRYLYPAILLCLSLLLSVLVWPVEHGRAEVGDWTTYSFTGDVRAIGFDQGTLWLATGGGGVQFDPPQNRSTVFTNTDGLPGNDVTSVAIDRNRDVWFGVMGRGLSRRRHDTGVWRTFTTLDGLASERVSVLVIDENTLWVGTEDGLSLFLWARDADESRDTFVFSDAYRASRGVPVGHTNDIALSASTLYVATENGVSAAPRNAPNLKDPASWTRYTQTHGLPDIRVTALIIKNGEVWAGTRAGVARFDGTAWIPVNAGLPSPEIRDLALVDGEIWVATVNGTARFDGTVWVAAGGGTGPLGPRTIAQSPDGEVWVGAGQNGLGRMASGLWQFTEPAGPASNDVAVVFTGGNDRLWFGFQDGGVSRFDRSLWTSYTTSDGLVSGPIVMAAEAPDSTLWFGSFGGGLARLDDHGTPDKSDDIWEQFDQNNSVFEGVPEDPDFVVVNAWAVDHGGGQWFSNFGAGAQYLSAQGQWTTFRARAGELSSARIRSIAVAADSSVWFATDNRLSRYVPATQTWTVYGVAEGLLSPQVNAVTASPTGDVWAGTDAGITRFDASGAASSFGLPAGLNTSRVTALAADARGHLYVGAPSGVGRLDAETLAWEVFTPDNSPLADALIKTITVRRITGEVWIGTGRGISRYESGVLPARPTLTGIDVYPNPFDPSKGDADIVFARLADGAQVSILTVDGLLVRQIPSSDMVAQRIRWDARNQHGQPVAGGIYLYIVTAPDGSHRAGKIAVIR